VKIETRNGDDCSWLVNLRLLLLFFKKSVEGVQEDKRIFNFFFPSHHKIFYLAEINFPSQKQQKPSSEFFVFVLKLLKSLLTRKKKKMIHEMCQEF
jgi:hypothetical protein